MRAASPIAERPISQTGTLFCHKLFSFAIWLIVWKRKTQLAFTGRRLPNYSICVVFCLQENLYKF